MATIGKILKAKREEKHLTIEDVSAQTKVGLKFLQAIENEEYYLLPPQSFAIGFVKLFAKAVGMDEGAVVAQFKRETGHAPEPREQKADETAAEPRLNRRIIPAWVYLAIIAIVVLILLGSYGWFRSTPKAVKSTSAIISEET